MSGTGLQKKLNYSEVLQEITGKKRGSRPEATKQIWVYIKDNELQKESDKRIIVADALFKQFCNKKEINMMKLAGCLSNHLEE